MKIALLLATAVLGVAAAQAASAATETSNISASAEVSTVCTMESTALAFGEVALTGATNGTATVDVTCTGGGAYTVGLGDGTHNVAAQRNLQSGSNILAYDLFKETGRTTRWGDAGAGLVSGVGTAVEQSLTVYGQVTTGQTLVAGNGTPYTDTVLVTLTY
ncbi:spore coat U domain-containing protein [Phenylobacterium sp. LjRoot225]|uniref:Csu type fimbrial protein n=1 Tax=Phenylobacterium sp. LjRoot225 TaxID=3342285 RepID=UPI003ED11B42